ncbi:non-ribosomal peptide synthase/polyketide synthase, partial [Silvibacterium bohemicum]
MTAAQLLSHLYALGTRVWIEDERVRISAPAGVITDALRREIKEHREALRGWLERGSQIDRPPLVRQQRPERIPLSFAQLRLWFLDQMEGAGATYNIPEALRMEGDLNTHALQSALQDVVARHEILRTVFPAHDGSPYQSILPVDQARIVLRCETATEESLPLQLAEAASTGFNLGSELPLGALLFELAPRRHVLLLVLHHIAGDGWSIGSLFKDLAAAYEARCLGLIPDLPELAVQYADFTLWQRQLLGEENDPQSFISQKLAFWRAALNGSPDELDLPVDSKRPPVPSHRGRVTPLRIHPVLHRRLVEIAQTSGATLFMVLQAGLAVLLRSLGGGEDIPIGSPIAGRGEPALEELVGLFLNTLVLRADVSGNPSFRELLARVRAFDLDAYEHQDVPFERIVEALQPQRSLARHPIFQVMVVLQNAPSEALALQGLTIRSEPVPSGVSKFDLGFGLTEQFRASGELAGIYGGLEYSLDLFSPSTAERIAAKFLRVLEQAAEDPDAPLDFLERGERERLLEEFNRTEHFLPDQTLVDLFEAQVERTPDAVAVVFGADSLTYSQLNTRANQWAHYLIAQGVGPERMVGIAVDRSPEMVAVLWATLKTGAAYLPLDPNYPAARVMRMLSDARPVLVVSSNDFCTGLPEDTCTVIPGAPEVEAQLSRCSTHNPSDTERIVPLLPRHPAYIIYTSGSTGVPKGVVIEHRSTVTFSHWAGSVYTADEWAGVLASTSICFDLSVFELLVALIHGGTAILVESALELPWIPARDRVRLVNTVPSIARALVDSQNFPPEVSTINLAGEMLPGYLLRDLYTATALERVYNLYGPSEDTTYSTGQICARGSDKDPAIGGPLWNTSVYVLDRGLEPTPTGVKGEVYIAGAGLARGYLNRPGLTSERFVADPHGHEAGGRMYRTGDLGCWRDDGTLEFLGRADQQVKIRGFRIELGEVEAALMLQPNVKQAAVVARDGKQLVAYFVAEDGSLPEEDALRRGLSERLPDYMLPSAYVRLNAFPLTPNGKLDRKALPAPELRRDGHRGPRTKTEEILCGLFREVLRLEHVGVEDNFFRLGGDSIVSIQLVSRARRAGLELTPRDVFQQQTVEALAALAERAESRELLRPDSDEGIGEFEATPIMRWMWERGGPTDRFSQSITLQVPDDLTETEMLGALQALIDTHDVLRMRVEHGTRLSISPRGAIRAQAVLTRVQASVDGTEAAKAAEEAEGRLDPAAGRVFQAVWFTGGDKALLFLVIHHLAVDGVSWRILLGDLEAAWHGIDLDPVGTPYRTWARHLESHASASSIEAELPAWRRIVEAGRPLLPGRVLDPSLDTYASAGHLQQILSGDLTAALIAKVSAAFHSGMNDVLLAALAIAIDRPVLVDVEGHGRESANTRFDLSRTVGWFTSLYPVSVHASEGSAGATLKQVKEQLRTIPGNGLGFGLLRYLHPEISEQLRRFEKAQVGFNYLGRLATDGMTASAKLGAGPDDRMGLAYMLELNAIVLDGPTDPVVSAAWTWAGRHLAEDEVHALASRWQLALESMVREVESGAGGHTPSDFPLVAVSQQQVEELEGAYPELEDILPLTPLQEGLLFHALYDESAPDIYTVQFVLELEGKLDAVRMKKAAETLVRRHANLRSAIRFEKLQVIARNAPIAWREVDLPEVALSEQPDARRFLEADQRERFDLSQGLLRFALVRLSSYRHLLVLTNHHILLDGWSMPLLFGELIELYSGNLSLPRVRPYRDYLEWHARQNREGALEAWCEYLAGIEEPTRIARGAASKRKTERWEQRLPAELTMRLHEVARQHGLTLNTMLQGLWGVLLGRLTGRDDVTFGITVSGRPAELAGVEQMIGLFINTLPLRIKLSAQEKLSDLWSQIQESQAGLLAHQHVGLAEIQRALGVGELFDTLLVFENYPMDTSQVAQRVDGLRATGLTGKDATHYPLTLIVAPFSELLLRLDYQPDLVGDGTAIGERLVRLLTAAVESSEQALSALGQLSVEERGRVLEEFNATEFEVAAGTLVDRFEDQVDRSGSSTALWFDGETVSYDELNRRANRVAHFLIGRRVGPESLVGICMERTPAMVVAILGALKAGAGYVPLDPEYPSERLQQMLEGVSVVLSRAGQRRNLPASIDVVDLDEASLDRDGLGSAEHNPSDEDRISRLQASHAAYVIYTSGSMGKPKGVVVEHRALLNHMEWMCAAYPVDERDTVLFRTSMSFDAAVWELFLPLLSGARVCLVGSEVSRDPVALHAAMERAEVTVAQFVPTLLEAVCASDTPKPRGLRMIFSGGEALSNQLARRVEQSWGVPLVNLYGPTETTVQVAHHACAAEISETGAVPIGRPIANTRLYLLDDNLEPVPLGVAGELYVSGANLARGYLGRAALTAERFVANPYQRGALMYRTGDRARWKPDGSLEFLGRADQQMKIRGYRIEPGEIEAALKDLPDVALAAVDLREGKQLVAYVVAAEGATLDQEVLRRRLRDRLPDYLIPAAIEMLNALPMMPNGKIDRKALPAPRDRAEGYRRPRTWAEEILCEVFREVLGLEQVGIGDNFFRLGGDSIVSIQLVSRARRAGLSLTPRDVFQRQTVEALAAVAQKAESRAHALRDGEDAIGVFEATPIMRWMWERGGAWNRFSQSVTLMVPAGLTQQQMQQALQALIDTHDVLRLRVEDGMRLRIEPRGAVRAESCWTRVDTSAAGPEAAQIATEAERRLDPASGRIFQAVRFTGGEQEYLFLTIHHLAVDGVSWRILLPDLESAWRETSLDAVQTPYRTWARHLNREVMSEATEAELPFWEGILKNGKPLLPGSTLDPSHDTYASAGHLHYVFSAELTSALLSRIPAAFHAGMNDILLSALARAMGGSILINVEGHGRESKNEGFDLSRTVGWFTTLYPVSLHASGGSAASALKKTKEQLRAIPRNGLGYGLLRHLHPTAAARLKEFEPVQIGFNYLGRFGTERLSQEFNLGTGADPAMPLAHFLEVNAVTVDSPAGPLLSATWTWAGRHLSEPAVQEFAGAWEQALRDLATEVEKGAEGHTPSDFPLVDLSQEQIDEFEAAYPGLEEILPLSPLQEGLLFHALYDQGASDIYMVQFGLEFEGDLDAGRMRRAVEALSRRHGNLRAVIRHEGLPRPVQIIARSVGLTWREETLAGLPDREEFLASDRKDRFSLAGGPLLRCQLLWLGPQRNLLLFTAHHLLLDGWSMPTLIGELLALYRTAGDTGALPHVRPYRDYLAWLAEQDEKAALDAWRDHLADYEGPAQLGASSARPAPPKRCDGVLDRASTARLQAFARERGLTQSVLLQGMWSLLLGRLTNRDDVAFGVAVSGRPADLPGVESMVGLFINTLPLRVKLHAGQSIAMLLDQIQESQSILMAYQYVGLAAIQRAAGQEELFNTLFVFENYPIDGVAVAGSLEDLRIVGVEGHDAAHYPLTLVVLPGDELRIRLDYDPDRFSETEASSIVKHLIRFLNRALDYPDASLQSMELLDSAERKRLLEEFNPSPRPLPEGTMAEFFERHVLNNPDAPAVVFGDQGLTYAELNGRANFVAHRLIAAGIGPESLVAICVERSLELVVALLGIVKAGACYVPIDPELPQARREALAADAGIALTITSLDMTGESDEQNPCVPVEPQRPAYVNYTSGSTGRPKGVLVPQIAVIRLVCNADYVELGSSSRVLHLAPLSFDAATFELWGALLNGGCVVMAPPGVLKPEEITAIVSQREVDTLWLTAGLFQQVVEQALPGLHEVKQLLAGGDVLSVEHVNKFRSAHPACAVINGYGPTENTTFTACHRIEILEGHTIPIGRPIGHTRVYVLDSWLDPVPVGVIGELYAAGLGLARGYRNQAAQTAERFVANPYGEPGERIYRTGDRVKWRADGRLEFLGRADQQVKIRGFRIEPGEIEAELHLLPGIEQAAVLVHHSAAGGKQLVAYMKAAAGAVLDDAALHRELSRKLPDYMVPSVYMALAEMPLTANGKLDRKALPAPQRHSAGYREPHTPAQQMLCAIFAEVLKLDRVGLDDNFFHLGGHSLLAMRLISRIRAAWRTELPIRAVFEAPTVAKLALILRAGDGIREALVPQLRPARIPLSYAQQRLWFLHRMEELQGNYNIVVALRLEGELDADALEEAMADVCARHESLRTIFVEADGTPWQQILPGDEGRPRFLREETSEAQLGSRLAEAAGSAIDLSRETPLRAWLFRSAADRHVLLLVVHHIAGDGWSMGLLAADLRRAYEARLSGKAPGFAALPVQYADYTLWQRNLLGAEEDPQSLLSQQLNFWRSRLAGLPEELSLPVDHLRPAVMSYRGGRVPLRIGQQVHRGLLELTQSSGASLFMVLQAALAALLTRLGCGEDIPIGTPIAARGEQALEELVGFLVNTLVLRTDVSGDPRFLDLLERVKAFDLDAYGHQDVPFERVVEALRPKRSLARHPLFQVMLALQNTPQAELQMPGLVLLPQPIAMDVAKFDLTFTLWERRGVSGQAEGIEGELEYSRDLFEPATAEAIAGWYERLLAEVAEEPALRLHSINLVSATDRSKILKGFNGERRLQPAGTLSGLFEEQVERSPHAAAVEGDGVTLTYGELNARANRLAWKLKESGVERGGLVAVPLERSAKMIVAILAIVKAGMAYLPLDPAYPRQRVDSMLRDSGASVLDLERMSTNEDNLGEPASSEDLAYVMYTSGSTGKPKGIAIPHKAIIRLVHDSGYVDLKPEDRIAHVANTSFDAATFEIWGALLNGGCVVILPRETTLSTDAISRALRELRIDSLFLTTALFNQIARETPQAFSGLRDLLFGGEAVDPACVREVLAHGAPRRLLHVYGPTENTTFSTWHLVEGAEDVTVPIGRPVGNTRVYVLDDWLEPVPVGVAGELYVAGAGLARGYQRRPAQSAERFVADPWSAHSGERMYRTGDRVRWNANGELEFLGRADGQVKIRGFRIEPGEIEACLRSLPAVEQAVVLVREAGPGGKQLVAYVKARHGSTLEEETLRQGLNERLPEYMVPAVYVILDEIPLTANGKLDTKALPAPERRVTGYRAPRTPEEEILCGIFAEVLKLDRVGLDDNFFRLGGHSLLATRLVSRIRVNLGVELPIRALFEAATVAELALRLHIGARARAPLVKQSRPERIPLSYAQQRLWFLDRMEGPNGTYNIPAALRLEGELNAGALEQALQDLITRHESLRTIFVELEGIPHQQILLSAQCGFKLIREQVDEADLSARLAEAASTPFDLSWETPLRTWLFQLESNLHILLIVMHHIAGDGWSMGPLAKDLNIAYAARSRGSEPKYEPLGVQYADYSVWQRELLGREGDAESELERQLSYWRGALAALPEELRLPVDRARPSVPSYRGGTVGLSVSAAVHERLVEVARSTGASLFMVLQAGLAALLSRLGSEDEIALGSPVAGRGERALEDLIGFFVNTLVLRTDVSGDPDFVELVQRVRRFNLEAYSHQDVPFERVVEALAPDRSLARHPLFQVMIALQNTPGGELEMRGLVVRPEPVSMNVAKFDLSLGMWERRGSGGEALGLAGGLEYSEDLFDRETAERIARWYERVLESASKHPETRLHQLELIDEAERRNLLEVWNGDRRSRPQGTLAGLFEAQVRRNPLALAVESGEERVSYGELKARANQIARHLRASGLQRGGLVALRMERGAEMLAAMLGVIKAGGCYLPLDLSYPAARVEAMLSGSGAQLYDL